MVGIRSSPHLMVCDNEGCDTNRATFHYELFAKVKKVDSAPLYTRVGISNSSEKWKWHGFNTKQHHFGIF